MRSTWDVSSILSWVGGIYLLSGWGLPLREMVPVVGEFGTTEFAWERPK